MWNFLKNSTIDFRMFSYLLTCFLRVMVSLKWRLRAVSKIHVVIYPYLISEGIRKCSTLWPSQQRTRDSQETWHQIMFDLVTFTATNPWLSGNMAPNITTCENGCSNFLEYFRIVALKLLDPYHQINQINLISYCDGGSVVMGGPLWWGVRCDGGSVVMLTFMN